MDADWDLNAIVRGCSTVNNTLIPNAATKYDSFSITPSLPFNNIENSFQNFHGHFDQPLQNNGYSFHDFSGIFDDDNNDPFLGLQEICQVFCVDPPLNTENTRTVSATPVAQVFQSNEQTSQVQPLQQMNANMPMQENVSLGNNNFPSPPSFPGTIVQPVVRQKKRKNQQTRVIKEVTHEQLAADSWAWRKYGQKLIKGSPYPRNYYRCNMSKGCGARKQVERSLTDPENFVVSYTNDHTHPRPSIRSSLTGVARYKYNPINGLNSIRGQNKMSITTTNNNDNFRKTISLPMGSSHSSPGSGSRVSSDTPAREGKTTKQNDDVEMTENVAAYDNEEDNIMMVNDLMMNGDENNFTFKDLDESNGADTYGSGALITPPWTPTDYIAADTMFGVEGGDEFV